MNYDDGDEWEGGAECCELTGLPLVNCDCPDCYFERHEEPKPCSQCGGVGGHIFGCVS